MIADDTMVVVCDRCLRACCWHGRFMCDGARSAGTRKLPVSTLRRLNKEHESWWNICPDHGVSFGDCGCVDVDAVAASSTRDIPSG